MTATRDDYQLGRVIGRGASGEVRYGIEVRSGTEVAIRVLCADLADDPQFIARLAAQRVALCQAHHPNLVRVRDVVIDDGPPRIVMDVVDGASLVGLVEGNQPIAPIRAGRLVGGALAAVATLHAAAIVHGDLTPENVLIAVDGSVRVTDFGIAGLTAPDLLTPADDVHAAGVLLHRLLTGLPPGRGGEPARRDELPDELVALLDSMLAADPDQRPSARQARRELADLMPALALLAPLPPYVEPVAETVVEAEVAVEPEPVAEPVVEAEVAVEPDVVEPDVVEAASVAVEVEPIAVEVVEAAPVISAPTTPTPAPTPATPATTPTARKPTRAAQSTGTPTARKPVRAATSTAKPVAGKPARKPSVPVQTSAQSKHVDPSWFASVLIWLRSSIVVGARSVRRALATVGGVIAPVRRGTRRLRLRLDRSRWLSSTRIAILAAVVAASGGVAAGVVWAWPSSATPTETYAYAPAAYENGLAVSRTWALSGKHGETLQAWITLTNGSQAEIAGGYDEVIPKSVATQVSAVHFSPMPDVIINPDPVVRINYDMPPREVRQFGYTVSLAPTTQSLPARLAKLIADQQSSQAAYLASIGKLAPITLTSITVSPPRLDLIVGQAAAATLSGVMSDGSVAPPVILSGVRWSSSDRNVAAIDATTITAVGTGTASISAQAGDLNENISVSVTGQPSSGLPADNNTGNNSVAKKSTPRSTVPAPGQPAQTPAPNPPPATVATTPNNPPTVTSSPTSGSSAASTTAGPTSGSSSASSTTTSTGTNSSTPPPGSSSSAASTSSTSATVPAPSTGPDLVTTVLGLVGSLLP